MGTNQGTDRNSSNNNNAASHHGSNLNTQMASNHHQAISPSPGAPPAPAYHQLASNNAFADPNMVMVATLAALAASSMQQASQQQQPQMHHPGMMPNMHGAHGVSHNHVAPPANAATTNMAANAMAAGMSAITPQVAAAARKMLSSGSMSQHQHQLQFNANANPHMTQPGLAALLEMASTNNGRQAATNGGGVPLSSHALSSFLSGAAGATTPPQHAPAPSGALQQIHTAIQSQGSGSADGSTSINGLSSASYATPSQHTSRPGSYATAQYSGALVPAMQNWTAKQLEHHVSMLQQLNQPVPQTVGLLLAEARKKEEKRAAKRVANRKSACTSRARKKALVEEMTKTNARLRRHALILSLLPDLVVAITLDGEITFCSDQVQRVLRHDAKDLIGAHLERLVVPSSRETLATLVKDLVDSQPPSSISGDINAASKQQAPVEQRNNGSDATGSKNPSVHGNGNENSNASGQTSSGGRGSDAAVVSEQSFPLSVVEVDSKQAKRATVKAEVDASDNSTGNGSGKQQTVSSLTNSASLTRSPMAGSSSGDDDAAAAAADNARASEEGKEKRAKAKGEVSSKSSKKGGSKNGKNGSSDDASSLSSDANNMQRANKNLSRNVRLHNKHLSHTKKLKGKGPKDDVTGASVTENNASARLSSLQHLPDVKIQALAKESAQYESNGDQSSSDDSLLAGVEEKKKGENASDDSGYRESNDSREETSSSESDTSTSKGRAKKKPLSQTTKLWLIRSDLSTVWCEVTSSIRTRTPDEEGSDFPTTMSSPPNPAPKSDNGSQSQAETREILLCLRPIDDGGMLSDESLRLHPSSCSGVKSEADAPSSPSSRNAAAAVSAISSGAKKADASSFSQSDFMDVDDEAAASGAAKRKASKRPPKKRSLPTQNQSASGDGEAATKTKRKKGQGTKKGDKGSSQSSETEKSVVESLMLMNKCQ
eukprot:CAMPEP_0119549162 /NCGR_PEP_ID=MMETSP1352-20130426/2929_1 /TAXON_ID=265584 /ORGANISM="Stauroneis constricta, Strain CCMP1120" /LENGTH=943 /DNA_ID=CAMNT_0007594651 /DNA_START=546 /DNA_END=3377 /DNA_ORIENTATION=+